MPMAWPSFACEICNCVRSRMIACLRAAVLSILSYSYGITSYYLDAGCPVKVNWVSQFIRREGKAKMDRTTRIIRALGPFRAPLGASDGLGGPRLLKQPVGLEERRKLSFESQNLFGFVGVLRTALITKSSEWTIEMGWGLVLVGLAQRNLVSEHHVGVLMKLLVLADHNPSIRRVFPRAHIVRLLNVWREKRWG